MSSGSSVRQMLPIIRHNIPIIDTKCSLLLSAEVKPTVAGIRPLFAVLVVVCKAGISSTSGLSYTRYMFCCGRSGVFGQEFIERSWVAEVSVVELSVYVEELSTVV